VRGRSTYFQVYEQFSRQLAKPVFSGIKSYYYLKLPYCRRKTLTVTTCSEYRTGLVLSALKKRLSEEDLSEEEREVLEAEAARLETELKLV